MTSRKRQNSATPKYFISRSRRGSSTFTSRELSMVLRKYISGVPSQQDLRRLRGTALCIATALMIYATPTNLDSYSAFFRTEANQGSTNDDSTNDVSENDGSTYDRLTRDDSTSKDSTAQTLLACALCSACSTLAIRSSIMVPVNFISNVPVFLPGRGLGFIFSWPLRENSTTEFLAKSLTRH